MLEFAKFISFRFGLYIPALNPFEVLIKNCSPWNVFFRFTARINDAVKYVETAMKRAGQQKHNLDAVTFEQLKKRAAEIIAKMEDEEGQSKNHHDCLTCILVCSVVGAWSQETSS